MTAALRRSRRGLVTFVTTGVVFSALLAAPPDRAGATPVRDPATVTNPAPTHLPTPAEALASAKQRKAPVVVEGSTTATDRLTANPNGTLTLQRALVPVRKRVAGTWTNLDATLRSNADGSISPAVTTSSLAFSSGGSGPLVTMRDAGRSVALSLPVSLPKPTVSGAAATYRNVLPDVDLVMTADVQGGFTQVLVVRNAAAAANPAVATLSMAIRTEGLKVTADAAGNLTAADPRGRSVFSAGAPLMWDSTALPGGARLATAQDGTTRDAVSGQKAASDHRGPGAAARVKPVKVAVANRSATESTIALTPDRSLLSSAATFPVFIDPPWTPTGAAKSGWATVTANFPGSNYWNKTPDPHGRMQVGNSGEIKSRTLLNFPIPVQLLSGADIDTATLYTLNQYSYTCSPATQMNVTAPSATLTPGNANWNAWNTSMGTVVTHKIFAHGYNSSCPAAGEGFDIKGTIQAAVSTGRSTQTFGLMAANESDHNAYKEFTQDVTISITYNHPPKTPDHLSTSPATACPASTPSTVGDGQVTLFAQMADPNGGNLGAEFVLWKTSDAAQTPLASSDPALLTYPDGRDAVFIVPVAALRAAALGAVTQFSWRVRVKDELTYSGWSQNCSFNFDPTRTGSPIVTRPATTTIGQGATFQIAKPEHGVTPSGYLYQLNGGPPAKVVATAGNASILVSPTRVTNTLAVTSLSAGSNIGDTATIVFNSAAAAVAADQDTTGDGVPDLRAVGAANGLPAGLWQASGIRSGVATNATNIGIHGNGVVGDEAPTNFTGARTITGHFTGTGPQDFLVYYAGAPNPGSGMVIRSPGDGSALKPQYNGNEYNLSAGLLQDIDGLNPVQLANAGNASGQGLAYPDLIAVNGDSTYGYRLTYYASQNGVLNFQFPASLTNLTPTGGTDWNSWRITSAQVAGGTALYLWNTSTGALYLWTALAYNLETQVLSYTSHTIAASGWNAGATRELQAADANLDGTPDLWTVGPSATATLYLLTNLSTTPTLTAQAAQTLVTPNHGWALNDGTTGSVTATDDVGTATLTGVGGAVWNTGDLFSPSVLLNGTNSALTSPASVVATGADFSVSAWVKPVGTGGVLLSQDGTSTAAMKVWVDPADATWRFGMSRSDVASPTWDIAVAQAGSVRAGTWTHLTATYRSSTGVMTLYVDEAVAATASHTVTWNAGGNFRVGDTLAAGVHTSYFAGQVAQLRTWNRATTEWGAFRDLTLADIDGDAKADLNGVRAIEGSLARWHGGTAGAFNYIGDWGPGWSGYRDFAAADFNSDGKADLVGVRNSDGVLARWDGDGGGGFSYSGDWGPGWGSYRDFVAADINSDGKADLVAVRISDGGLARWYGNGSGAFSYAGDWGPGWSSYRDFAAADFNGDGKKDLVAVRISDGALARWYGDGAGGFTYAGDWALGWGNYRDIAAADINNDGKADLVAVTATDGALVRSYGNGTGGFTAPV